MMKIIGWMLNRMVAVRFFGILLGISFFVLSLDALTNAKDLQALRPHDGTILLQYMLYRAPAVITNYMGISMLLAMLLSLTELSYRNEMAAMWAAGLSPARIRPILDVAMARFQHEQSLRQELAQARNELQERKVIDRAKGLLMQRQGLTEQAAYEKLRKTAMDRGLKLAEVAQRILDVADLLA